MKFQLYAVLLGSLFSLTGPAVSPSRADDVDAWVSDYLSRPRSEQRQISERLIRERLEPALRLALDDEERADEQQFALKVLTRVAQGQTLTEKGLRKTLKKIAVFEQLATLDLARQYRAQTKRRFNDDPSAVQRRLAAWHEVQQLWVEADESVAGQVLLIDWLQESLVRLAKERVSRLPARPDFAHADLFASRANRSPNESSLAGAPPSPRSATTAETASPPSPQAPSASARQKAPSLAPAEWPKNPTPFSTRARTAPARTPPKSGRTLSPLEASTGVNLTELEARVVGFNSALAALHGSLLARQGWTIDELAAAVDQLAVLSVRRSDLQLYLTLVSELDRDALPPLRATDSVLSALRAKIDTVRRASPILDRDPIVDRDTREHLLNALLDRMAQLDALPADGA